MTADGGYYAAIVDGSFDAIISKDTDGVIQTWNHAAERLFGWSAREMVGQSIRRLIPADRQSEEDAILARIRAGEFVPKFETVRQHKSGALLPIAVTVSPIHQRGEIVGASKIAHDISAQLAVREQLADSEDRFRALAENIPQLAWMADRTGWIFWYNQRWFDYTGTTLEDMQGWGWTKVHHPEHLDRVVARIQESWDSGMPWEDTFPLLGKEGAYRWFLSRAMPIRDAQGDIKLWFGTNTDVTLQREHERQIEMLMGEVNHRSKNMLTMIQALVRRTLTPGNPDFIQGFESRLSAIGANLTLLTGRGWIGVPAGELIRSQLFYVQDLIDSRIRLDGPLDLMLAPPAAEAIGLAIHELATNAAKYGSLANEAGSIAIEWGLGDGGSFFLRWSESGGPPVAPPVRNGFGSIVIGRNPQVALGAMVDLDYDIRGVVWTLTAPLENVTAR